MILRSGRVAGTWSYKQEKDRFVARVHPFYRLSKRSKQEIEDQASGMAGFMNRCLDLTFEPVCPTHPQ